MDQCNFNLTNNMLLFLLISSFLYIVSCDTSHDASFFEDLSYPISYIPKFPSYPDNLDLFTNSGESDYHKSLNEKERNRVDKHIYLHILPLTRDEISKNNNKKLIETVKPTKKIKEITKSREEIEKQFAKIEKFDEDMTPETKKWNRSNDGESSETDRKRAHIDKHIFLHVLPPTVNQITVKHPVYVPSRPSARIRSKFTENSIPAVPVLPVIPLEHDIYLVRKTRGQTGTFINTKAYTKSVTLRPDIFFV